MKYKIQFILFLSFLFVSCKAMLVLPDESDAVRAKNSGHQYDLAILKQSHYLYVDKCGGCHTLYLPSYKISSQWKSVIDEMAIEAKLDSTEKEAILNYLIVMSEKSPESNRKN